MTEALIYLDPDSTLNLQNQIRKKLVDAIMIGTFPGGSRLPSSLKLAEQLGVAKDQITRGTSFVNDLGADSLDTVELVMELEEEFDINIPDDAAEKIQTVGQAVDHIQEVVESDQGE